jgi:hypothetical protein
LDLLKKNLRGFLLHYRPTVEKLLVVADPQLIGEKDEGILGFLTRNDADR